MEQVKAQLQVEGRRVPTDNDARWNIAVGMLKKYSFGSWGQYASTRFQMGEILRCEREYEKALTIYLEVAYFEIADLDNYMVDYDNELLGIKTSTREPSDRKREGFLLPLLLQAINRYRQVFNISDEQLKRSFIECSSRIQKSIDAYYSVTSAYDILIKALNKEQRKSIAERRRQGAPNQAL